MGVGGEDERGWMVPLRELGERERGGGYYRGSISVMKWIVLGLEKK